MQKSGAAAAVRLIGKGIKAVGGLAGRVTGKKSPLDWSKHFGHAMRNPTARKAVNAGVPTVAGAGALYGSNRLGHSSGREQGVGEGFDAGTELGIQTALANQPQDPGFFGRLLEVFKGNEQSVTAQSLQNYLDEYREDALNAILKGE